MSLKATTLITYNEDNSNLPIAIDPKHEHLIDLYTHTVYRY